MKKNDQKSKVCTVSVPLYSNVVYRAYISRCRWKPPSASPDFDEKETRNFPPGSYIAFVDVDDSGDCPDVGMVLDKTASETANLDTNFLFVSAMIKVQGGFLQQLYSWPPQGRILRNIQITNVLCKFVDEPLLATAPSNNPAELKYRLSPEDGKIGTDMYSNYKACHSLHVTVTALIRNLLIYPFFLEH